MSMTRGGPNRRRWLAVDELSSEGFDQSLESVGRRRGDGWRAVSRPAGLARIDRRLGWGWLGDAGEEHERQMVGEEFDRKSIHDGGGDSWVPGRRWGGTWTATSN